MTETRKILRQSPFGLLTSEQRACLDDLDARLTALEAQLKALTAGKAAGDDDTESPEDWGRVVRAARKIKPDCRLEFLNYVGCVYLCADGEVYNGYPAIVAKLTEMGVW